MKYSIEIGKIVEGALKHDQLKVINYTKQFISKLEEDDEIRAASKFRKMLAAQSEATLTAMGVPNDSIVPVDSESRTALADVVYPSENNVDVILSKSNADKSKTLKGTIFIQRLLTAYEKEVILPTILKPDSRFVSANKQYRRKSRQIELCVHFFAKTMFGRVGTTSFYAMV